ncbi:hypothetical protein BDW59DRAFT_178849 [Aspergillus cavernicola]|uniref:Uncharacterized protein n=1 Tax=Aspergillus cavernicola TaxID=176166 RepID=A0ABR4IL96_9EURO
MSGEEELDDWQPVRQYVDHLGHPVIYSTVPLDTDHENLRDYLLHLFWNDEVLPQFEIYSYNSPGALACIEHNRREIAFRKQQHRDTPVGRCILLRSHSYRLGFRQDWNVLHEAGEGPDVVCFNRCFSSTRSEVDEVQSVTYQGALLPEAFELSAERVTVQTDISQISSLRYLSQRPGLSEEQLRQQISHQTAVGGFSLDSAFHISHDAGILTITNTPETAEPDLQYLVHAPFLSHLPDITTLALIESTARLFTAAFLYHLPAPKRVNFKFTVPESTSWSAILPAHHNALTNHQTKFPLGARHIFSSDPGTNEPPAAHRVTPQSSDGMIEAVSSNLKDPYTVFAVVLDRATFVNEAGIYFYISGYSNHGERRPFDPKPHPDDTEVWRSPGIADAARRLGTLVGEEEGGAGGEAG